MSDDWCGRCGTQMSQLTPCRVCGDMFCEDCLFEGCCSQPCLKSAYEDGDDVQYEDDEPWDFYFCLDCGADLDGDGYCPVCGEFTEEAHEEDQMPQRNGG